MQYESMMAIDSKYSDAYVPLYCIALPPLSHHPSPPCHPPFSHHPPSKCDPLRAIKKMSAVSSSAPASWRDPNVSKFVNPLPPLPPQRPGVDGHAAAAYKERILEYFCRSPFYDQTSLTASLRKGVRLDAAAFLRTNDGIYYQADVVQNTIPLVSAFYNKANKGLAPETTQLAHYYIINGEIRKAYTLRERGMHSLSIAAHHLTASVQSETAMLLEASEAELRSLEDGCKTNKRRRIVPGGAVRHVLREAMQQVEQEHAEKERARLAAERAAMEARQPRGLQQQQEEAEAARFVKVAQQQTQPVAFKDPRFSKWIEFHVAGGALRYTADGEERAPVREVVFDRVKLVLLLGAKRGAVLPPSHEAVLTGLKVLCKQANVPFKVR